MELLENGNGLKIYQNNRLIFAIQNVPTEVCIGLIKNAAVQGFIDLNQIPDACIKYNRYVG